MPPHRMTIITTIAMTIRLEPPITSVQLFPTPPSPKPTGRRSAFIREVPAQAVLRAEPEVVADVLELRRRRALHGLAADRIEPLVLVPQPVQRERLLDAA